MLITLLLVTAWLLLTLYLVSGLRRGRQTSREALRWKRAVAALGRQQATPAAAVSSPDLPLQRRHADAAAVQQRGRIPAPRRSRLFSH